MSELMAIYFLWKRELIRFFRSKSRVIGSLGMPFFFLAIMGSGMNGLFPPSLTGGSYMDYITPGILAMVLLFGSVFAGVIVIVDRQFGFLKETLVAPVGRTSIVVGKALGGATAAVLQGILMLGIALVLGAHLSFADAVPLILLMGLISFSFVALGIAIASTMEDMHGFQLISNFVIMPMFFLSGALFPLGNAPEIIRILASFDPLTYAVEGLRYFLIGSSSIPIMVCVGVLTAFGAVCTLAAAYLFNRIES